jgi:phosphate starvation-inducible membrane PsiE
MNNLNIKVDRAGDVLVTVFHKLALFTIGAATVWAAGWTFLDLFTKHHATIADLLLMFIYLEIGAMVGIYFKTNHMPVRFLLYIAITALTRHMVDIMSHSPIKIDEMLAVAGATLVIAISVLIVRYTSAKFPSDKRDEVV